MRITQTKNKDFLDEIIDQIELKEITQNELSSCYTYHTSRKSGINQIESLLCSFRH